MEKLNSNNRQIKKARSPEGRFLGTGGLATGNFGAS